MSQGVACKCPRSGLVVDVRRANYSAFNGYKRTPSSYSAVRCTACGACWRTDAKYVNELPDAPEVQPAAEETTRQQDPFRFLSKPYDPICIVTKEPHQPRENDPARCRSCGLFIETPENFNGAEVFLL